MPLPGKVRIKMDWGHIRNGEKQNSSYCPIAKAVKSGTNADTVIVDGVKIETWFGRVHSMHTLDWGNKSDREVAEFIRRFDSGQDVEPLEFDLFFG